MTLWNPAFAGPVRPPSLEAPVPARQRQEPLLPLWRTILGWTLMLPFLFYTTNGSLIPETGDVAFRATASGDAGLAHRGPVALVLLICCFLIWRQFPTVLAMAGRNKMLLAMPVLAICSVYWSYNPTQSAVSSVIMLVFTLFAFYIGGRFGPKRQFELILLTGAIAMPVSVLLAVLAPNLGTTSGAWRGIFGHKNNCGVVCVIFLVTALQWKAANFTQKTFRAFYVLLCLLLIGMSQSRGGWLLCAVALAVSAGLWVLQRMGSKEGLVALLAAIPLAIGGALSAQYFASLILTSVGKDPTLSQRTIIWSAVMDAIMVHPWQGYGCAAFWTGIHGPSANVVLTAGWVLSQAQDGYLDLWLQFGVGSLVILAFLVLKAALDAVRAFRNTAHPYYVRWCILVIVCTLIYNIGESSLGLTHLSWFAFLLGCIGLDTMARSKRNRPMAPASVRFVGSLPIDQRDAASISR